MLQPRTVPLKKEETPNAGGSEMQEFWDSANAISPCRHAKCSAVCPYLRPENFLGGRNCTGFRMSEFECTKSKTSSSWAILSRRLHLFASQNSTEFAEVLITQVLKFTNVRQIEFHGIIPELLQNPPDKQNSRNS